MLASRSTSRVAAELAPSIKTNLNDLERLLSRLTRTVLSEDADPELRRSVYLRRKTGTNVEYARTLLLRLEQDIPTANGVKIATQRQTIVADLAAKRDTIKQLNRTLIELDQLDVGDDEGDHAEGGGAGDGNADILDRDIGSDKQTATPGQQQEQGSTPGRESRPALRARKPVAAASPPQPSTTATTTTSASLFAGRPVPPPSTTLPDREQALTTSAAEQEAIKASLLTLAGQLKASNLAFAASLEDDKAALEGAVQGLDRNAAGLEGAGKRMGALRRMTEGKGLYGRLKLYALIAALWVAAFLLVFVGPKLRF